MAHVRRKFVEAARIAPTKKGDTLKSPQRAVTLIARLYRIESDCASMDPEQRLRERRKRAKPIFEELHRWCKAMQPKVSSKSVFGGAIRYALAELPLIAGYLDDGRLGIDNNPIERLIKAFATGRKGWMFFDSVAGANASTVLYSLLQTARLNGCEPHRYLLDVIERMAARRISRACCRGTGSRR